MPLWESTILHFTLHLLIQKGANPKVIQSLMRHTDLNLTMSKYTHLYAGQQRETIESLPDFIVQQNAAAMTGTYDCVAENRAEKNCPKTANQSEKIRTIPNNSCKAETSQDSGLNAVNCKETAFPDEKCTPAFSAKKWRRGDSNPRPVMFQDKRLHA